MPRLTTSIVLPLPIEDVFLFFGEAANLERITPPELRFRITTPQPIIMREGTLIQYRLRLFGIPIRWKTRISAWEPPHRFVDEQLSGPYRTWIHTHRFTDLGGSTLMKDEVLYDLPFPPLGQWAHPIIRMELNRIFAYRREAIQLILAPQRPG
jgi:ligand-binding SRPBCC domain-containing protein